MRIEKVINNNIISARDDKGVELVVMGRGIGFDKKPGNEITDGKIEKIFRLDKMDDREHFKELLASLPFGYPGTLPYSALRKGDVYLDIVSDEKKESLFRRKYIEISYLSPRKYLDTMVKSGYDN